VDLKTWLPDFILGMGNMFNFFLPFTIIMLAIFVLSFNEIFRFIHQDIRKKEYKMKTPFFVSMVCVWPMFYQVKAQNEEMLKWVKSDILTPAQWDIFISHQTSSFSSQAFGFIERGVVPGVSMAFAVLLITYIIKLRRVAA
jgi:hypothetical protein